MCNYILHHTSYVIQILLRSFTSIKIYKLKLNPWKLLRKLIKDVLKLSPITINYLNLQLKNTNKVFLVLIVYILAPTTKSKRWINSPNKSEVTSFGFCHKLPMTFFNLLRQNSPFNLMSKEKLKDFKESTIQSKKKNYNLTFKNY